jgi:hypothetical protein
MPFLCQMDALTESLIGEGASDIYKLVVARRLLEDNRLSS